MGGIGNVASWPERRRGGLVAKLLQRSLEIMREQGQTVSYLTPFSYAFYRRYGWEMFIDRKKFTLTPAAFASLDASRASGRVERVAADSELLGPIYEQYASQYNGMLHRETSHWWQNRVFQRYKGRVAVYKDKNEVVQGYMLYEVKQRIFRVHELIALNPEARVSLLRFIGMHDSMAGEVQLYVPVDDPLPFEVDDPYFNQKIEPYFMGRIVDVVPFLHQYPFLPADQRTGAYALEKEVALTLSVHDDNAPWNHGVFTVKVDAAGCATAVRSSSQPQDNVLACTIQTLSALLLGYQDAEYLHRTGRLTGEQEAVRQLSALMPKRTSFLADFF